MTVLALRNVRPASRTCDIQLDTGTVQGANFINKATGCDLDAGLRERAKRSSSFAPDLRPCGGGASRLTRLPKGAKPGTWSLTDLQTAGILDAALWAVELGLPLNRFVTINWEAAGVPASSKATGRFLKYAGDWLRRRGSQIAYVWVQERGPRVGQHVHILIHVPARLARRFSELQRRWLKACGACFCKGMIKSRSVGRSYRGATLASGAYAENLESVLRYILKQSHLGVALSDRPSASQSRVIGKRCATSENIGALSRSRATARRP